MLFDKWRETWTIYTRYTHPLTGLIKPMRRVFRNCKSEEGDKTVTQPNGIAIRITLELQVFEEPGLTYIPFQEWLRTPEDELYKYWSFQIGGTTNSLIINHEVDIDIPYGTLQAINNAENDILDSSPTRPRIYPHVPGSRRGIQVSASPPLGNIMSKEVYHVLIRG